jgi:hypothetical protein
MEVWNGFAWPTHRHFSQSVLSTLLLHSAIATLSRASLSFCFWRDVHRFLKILVPPIDVLWWIACASGHCETGGVRRCDGRGECTARGTVGSGARGIGS